MTGPQIIFPHRAISVDLHTHSAGDIKLVCVYGDVVGTWKARAPMWRALSKSAAASGKPFVWGGDWNTTEDEVKEIIGSMNLPGVSSVPLRSTCVTQGGGSVIVFL